MLPANHNRHQPCFGCFKRKKGGKQTTHWRSLKELKHIYIQDNLDLTDIWRDLNPEAKRYTWRQSRPEVHCRLDFFLVSLGIAGRISNADILPAYSMKYSKVKMKTEMKNEEANIESTLATLEDAIGTGRK